MFSMTENNTIQYQLYERKVHMAISRITKQCDIRYVREDVRYDTTIAITIMTFTLSLCRFST